MPCTPKASTSTTLVTVKKADYICIVKRNQPHLYRRLKTLNWRRPQVVTMARLPFPHAAQAIRITRRPVH